MQSKGSTQPGTVNTLHQGKSWSTTKGKLHRAQLNPAERDSSGQSLAVTLSPRFPLSRNQMCGKWKNIQNGQHAIDRKKLVGKRAHPRGAQRKEWTHHGLKMCTREWDTKTTTNGINARKTRITTAQVNHPDSTSAF